ncbi:hypothetical protein [Bradyrhizobium sp. 27S5]|uniref:hypothetical protein n=1 Tax=Bradyrhizobium sp. 27S5 TaxID=3139728 RepID=UPI0030CD941C
MSYTLSDLINLYRIDPQSPFLELSHGVRVKHDRLLSRIMRDYGSRSLRGIQARDLLAWHSGWAANGKIEIAHSLISRIRVLARFGATALEDRDCRRLLHSLGELRFERSPSRKRQMSADQAEQIRNIARDWFGWPSIAMAQALQFELRMTQKEVIGEWIPGEEGEPSDLTRRTEQGELKWVAGLQWSSLDDDFVLRLSGKRTVEVDIKRTVMVMEELAFYADKPVAYLTRADLPSKGPMIMNEITARPFSTAEFRRKWRLVANRAAIPKHVKNMDSGKSSRSSP